MKLEQKVSQVIKNESDSRLKNNSNLQRAINKYNDLKKKGFIEDDKYSVARPDVIGYSRYGHSTY